MAYTAPGVTYVSAAITKVEKACAEVGDTGCGRITVKVRQGPERGSTVVVEVPPEVSASGLSRGDELELLRLPGGSGQQASYSFFGVPRAPPLWLLFAVFVVAVLLVARLRGLMALVGLGVAAAVIGRFMLPALLTGHPVVPVAV